MQTAFPYPYYLAPKTQAALVAFIKSQLRYRRAKRRPIVQRSTTDRRMHTTQDLLDAAERRQSVRRLAERPVSVWSDL